MATTKPKQKSAKKPQQLITTTPTLYDLMLKSFKDLGFEIEEGSWVEETGYAEPTNEYWFDVTLLFDLFNKRKITGHYFFGADKNILTEHSVWTMDIVIEETNAVKISR